MNYLAHGYPYVDDPYFLAGTAIPDWMGVAHREIRLPPKSIEAWVDAVDPRLATIAQGIRQHHRDDADFHVRPAFLELNVLVGRMIRQNLVSENDHVRSLLAHIVPELLLDACLAEATPALLDEYYRAVEQIDADEIARAIEVITGKPPFQLTRFVAIFLRERFLWDYLDDERFCYRLRQILSRVNFGPLPIGFETLLPTIRELVRERVPGLLVTDPPRPG